VKPLRPSILATLLLITLTGCSAFFLPAPAPTLIPTPIPTATPLPTATPRPAFGLAFEETDCFSALPEGFTPTCGYLTVPEDHANPEGRTIEVYLVIFPGRDRGADPVVHLAGGPGGDGADSLGFYFSRGFDRILASRDYIMLDQRGVGYSRPSLDCPELDEGDRENPLRDCHDRLLAEGVDLHFYDAAQTAGDLRVLRDTLGYQRLNLYGVSYGTRVAQTAMRDHPDMLGGVVLDAAYPLDAGFYTEWAGQAQGAFTRLFEACAADPACAGAYPQLDQTFYRTVSSLDASALRVDYVDPDTGEAQSISISGGDLMNTTYRSLYFVDLIPLLPAAIAGMGQGETAPMGEVLSGLRYPSISEGMYWSAFCREEIAFENFDAVQSAASGLNPRIRAHYAESLAGRFYLCEWWDAGKSDPVENEPATSEVPALVMAGEFDPIVPVEWNQRVAGSHDNATLLVFRGLGHGVMRWNDCALRIGLAFYDDPDRPLNTSCMEALPAPPFVTD
jgi:pimeloyl-ACP methyl ester carboxylesterase